MCCTSWNDGHVVVTDFEQLVLWKDDTSGAQFRQV